MRPLLSAIPDYALLDLWGGVAMIDGWNAWATLVRVMAKAY